MLLWRALSARRVERATAARLRTGADGIVPGAGPIDLRAVDARGGVLMLHGFGDTPQTLAFLAEQVHARGYAVLVPLLPGHGRTLHAFSRSDADQWLSAARDARIELRGRHQQVAIVGLSMGGALAATIAAQEQDISALVLLAPYLDAPVGVRRLAAAHHLVSGVAPYVRSTDERSILDPAERARSLGYRSATPRLLHELVRTADRGRAVLAQVTAPTLIVQSRQDGRLAPAVAERALGALGSSVKRLEWLDGCGHVITVDYQREQVARLVTDWLDGTLRSSAESTRRVQQER
jgi:carboxylesterase